MNINNYLHSFKNAWDMLLDIPLPLKLETASDDDEVQENLTVCFPLVGAVLGLCAYIVAWGVSLLIPIPMASAVIVSIIITLGTELAASSSNLALLNSFIKSKISGKYDIKGANALDSNLYLDNPLSVILFLSLYLLKLFCIGLLIYHSKISWIIVTFTLSYLVRSQLVTETVKGTSASLIEVDDEKYAVKMPWLIAAVIVICVGLGYLPAAIIALLVAFALIVGFKKYSTKLGGVSAPLVGIFGVASELVFLLTGAAIVIR